MCVRTHDCERTSFVCVCAPMRVLMCVCVCVCVPLHSCEVALIQNEIADIFADDFSALTDEEGMGGNRKETSISETQSFTHLTYSKNKVRVCACVRVRVCLLEQPRFPVRAP